MGQVASKVKTPQVAPNWSTGIAVNGTVVKDAQQKAQQGQDKPARSPLSEQALFHLAEEAAADIFARHEYPYKDLMSPALLEVAVESAVFKAFERLGKSLLDITEEEFLLASIATGEMAYHSMADRHRCAALAA